MKNYSENLLEWYLKNGRSLPWRAKGETRADPYHVWLSEIMLQQTTVATVKGYFGKFLKLWPSVKTMAEAPQEDILDAWAGLGYYARARNLHRCAQEITNNHGGHFPTTAKDLKALPGIGDYTSAAIAAIAYSEPVAVVDGNIERVVSRLFRISERLPKAKKTITEKTQRITPDQRPGDFAQAMMDLGAAICTPKAPKCPECPFITLCEAYTAGDAERYPVKAPKKAKPTRYAVAFAATFEDNILLERRPQKGLLGGMPGLYSTPWIELEDYPDEYQTHAPASSDWQLLGEAPKHTFTHFHLKTRVMCAELDGLINTENGFWIKKAELKSLGLPTVFRKMTNLL